MTDHEGRLKAYESEFLIITESCDKLREKCEKDARDNQAMFKELKEKCDERDIILGRENLWAKLEVDSKEQYESRDSIVIHGVREMDDENLHVWFLDMCRRMGGNVHWLEVSVVHRLGPPRRGNQPPRPIIVKLTRRMIKSIVMRNKYKLRSIPGFERVFIEERLTDWRRDFIGRLKNHPGVTSIRTTDGRIWFSYRGKTWGPLDVADDFLKLLDEDLLEKDFYERVGLCYKYKNVKD